MLIRWVTVSPALSATIPWAMGLCSSVTSGPTWWAVHRRRLTCRFARGWLSDLKAPTYEDQHPRRSGLHGPTCHMCAKRHEKESQRPHSMGSGDAKRSICPLTGWGNSRLSACSHSRCSTINSATARLSGPLPWVASPMMGWAMCFMWRRSWWRLPVSGSRSLSGFPVFPLSLSTWTIASSK